MSRTITSAAEFGRVAVLMGGRSAEREVSLRSGQAVLVALQQQGIDAHPIDVDQTVSKQLLSQQFDRAFVVLHGRGGEDGEIQGLLQTLHIPYTGSGITGAVMSMNKRISKLIWQQQSLPTAKFVSLSKTTDTEQLLSSLGLPLIIKPVNEGSSIGMSKVTEAESLSAAIALAFQYDDDVIAEQWIHGMEYTISILEEEALPVIRLKTPHAFYDFDAKYQANTTEYHCPCGLDAETEFACQSLALEAFQALGMQGWGRIDVMANQQGEFFLLEANSVPGMTDHSLVPMAAKQAGLSFQQLVWRILQSSFEVHA